MRNRFLTLLCLFLVLTCDDGDVLTVQLNFDQVLERCTTNQESYVVFDTQDDPSEALILIFPKTTDNDLLFQEPTIPGTPTTLALNGDDIRFIYRTYNRPITGSNDASDICALIPPGDLSIVEDYEAGTGTVEVVVTIEDDDNDGIPSDLEGRGAADANGDFPNAIDSDLDGIPDYLDEDDDNDNVPTAFEIDTADTDGDGDPTTNPLNTDANHPTNADTIPDYLDPDDDGDGTLTRLEDFSGDNNPQDTSNVVTNSGGFDVSRYLEAEFTDAEDPSLIGFINNQYTRTAVTTFTVLGVNLDIITAEVIDLGTFTATFNYPIN